MSIHLVQVAERSASESKQTNKNIKVDPPQISENVKNKVMYVCMLEDMADINRCEIRFAEKVDGFIGHGDSYQKKVVRNLSRKKVEKENLHLRQ